MSCRPGRWPANKSRKATVSVAARRRNYARFLREATKRQCRDILLPVGGQLFDSAGGGEDGDDYHGDRSYRHQVQETPNRRLMVWRSSSLLISPTLRSRSRPSAEMKTVVGMPTKP